MARVPIEKKRKTRWPWVIGLVIVLLAAWGVTILLRPDDDPADVTPTAVTGRVHIPTAIPQPPNAPVTQTGVVQTLQELAPLGQDDLGRQVRLDGEVLSLLDGGFWIRAGDQALYIVSDREVAAGETVTVEGTLTTVDPDSSPDPSGLDEEDAGSAVAEVRLIERPASSDPGAAEGAAEPAPAGDAG